MSRPLTKLARVAARAIAIGWTLLGLNAAAEGPPLPRAPKPLFQIGDAYGRGGGAGAGVTFSATGAFLAWGQEDGSARIIPVADFGTRSSARSLGAADAQFSHYRGAPGPMMFSADGSTLVAGNFSHRIDVRDKRREGPDAIRAWDVATGKVRFTVPLDGLGRRLAITPDGRTLRASVRKDAATELVQSWDLGTGKPSGTLALKIVGAVATAFTPDGSALAVGDGDGAITCYEIPSGRVRATLSARRPDKVAELAFAPDGRSLAVVHADNTVEIRDAATGSVNVTIPRTGDDSGTFLLRPAFSADGRSLVLVGGYPIPHRPGGVAFAGRATRYDVATGAECGSIAGMEPGCNDLAFSPDGRDLAITATHFGGGTIPTGSLQVWEFPPR